MDNQNDTNVQEVMTEERDSTDTATQMANGQPDPSIDIVTTEAEKPPEDSSRPTRVRKQRSFTMSDEVHALLAAQAKRGGATIGMSAYLETLVLMAEELSLDQHVLDLLGSHAAKTGLTRTEFLSMLVLRAEYVVTWDQQANDTIGVLAARAGLGRSEFLAELLLKADQLMSWQPPQPKAKSWWRFWERPSSEEPTQLFSRVVDAEFRPQLPG